MAKSSSSSIALFVVAGLVVVGLIAYVVKRPTVPSSYDAFAQCLTDKGVKMFGAWWCPHCTTQKKLFGTAFKKVNYVECSLPGTQTMTQACKDEKIEGYPTWEFADKSRVSGEQSFATLAEKSGCAVPAEE